MLLLLGAACGSQAGGAPPEPRPTLAHPYPRSGHQPQALLAAARQTTAGGSLTVVATSHIGETPLDQAIAREFAPLSNRDVSPEPA